MEFVQPDCDLWKKLAAIVADEGLSLYDLEKQGSAKIRVVVSKPEVVDSTNEKDNGSAAAQGGVSSEDCTKVCRRLVVFLKVEGPELGLIDEPGIEVCSPGVNRELRLSDHFYAALGERVKVTPSPQANSEVSGPCVGELTSVDDEMIVVLDEISSQTVEFPLSGIKRAQIEFQF